MDSLYQREITKWLHIQRELTNNKISLGFTQTNLKWLHIQRELTNNAWVKTTKSFVVLSIYKISILIYWWTRNTFISRQRDTDLLF